jgi:hypothetical protein
MSPRRLHWDFSTLQVSEPHGVFDLSQQEHRLRLHETALREEARLEIESEMVARDASAWLARLLRRA